MATLSSCSKEFIKYPSDYNDPLFADIQKFAEDNNLNWVENNKEQYYKNATSTSSIYSKVVDEILVKVAEIGGGTHVKKDLKKDNSKIYAGKVYEIREILIKKLQ